MKKLCLLLLCCFAFLLSNLSYAHAIINFDVFPDGTPVPDETLISDQYAGAYGVTFRTHAPGLGYYPVAMHWEYYGGVPLVTSEPNSLTSDVSTPWDPIYMDFLSPYTGSINFAIIQATEFVPLNITAAILDSNEQVLDSVTFSVTGIKATAFNWGSLSGSNIAQLRFSGDGETGTGYFVDDINFSTNPGPGVVPEPTTLSLLGLGLVGLVFNRKKFVC